MVDNKDTFVKDPKIRIAGETYFGEPEDEESGAVASGPQIPTGTKTSAVKADLKREAALGPAFANAEGTPSLGSVLVRFLAPLFSTPAQARGALKLWNARKERLGQNKQPRKQPHQGHEKKPSSSSEPLT